MDIKALPALPGHILGIAITLFLLYTLWNVITWSVVFGIVLLGAAGSLILCVASTLAYKHFQRQEEKSRSWYD